MKTILHNNFGALFAGNHHETSECSIKFQLDLMVGLNIMIDLPTVS
jgi:hypothetical protein